MIVEGHDPKIDERLSDCLSSFYSLTYNLSAFVGPIIGGILYEHMGYREATDINMSGNFIFFLILLMFNCGSKVF